MASGLRPDPLGELKRSPDPLAAIREAYFKGGREGKGWEGEGGDEERRGGGTCSKVLGVRRPWCNSTKVNKRHIAQNVQKVVESIRNETMYLEPP